MSVNTTPEVADELVDAAPPSANVALVTPVELALAKVKTFVVDAERTTYDINTFAGEQTARQLRLACVKHRTGAKADYEKANAPFLAAQRRARELVGEVETLVAPLEAKLDAEIKAKEERKLEEKRIAAEAAAKRLAEIRGRLDAISDVLVSAAAGTSLEIQAAINQLFQADINEELFGDFTEEASARTARVMQQLTDLHAKVHAREQEQLELKRQQEELAEQRRRIAEQRAEQDRKDAAERKRLAAEERQAQAATQAKEDASAQAAATQAKPVPVEQDDAFEAERAAAAARLAEEQAATKSARDAELAELAKKAERIEPQTDLPELDERPDDEEILAMVARNFDVSQHEALAWITSFDVDAQVRRLKEIA